MSRFIRIMFVALVAALAGTAATARAATHLQVGFFDDASFRWSPEAAANLEQAAATGASVIHTAASWAQIAPTRPADAADANDPAYHLDDLDALVANASANGLRVMININGTPKWANGGRTRTTCRSA